MLEWPLIGRDTERRQLEAAVGPEGAVGAAIVGEAGIGKTRLAAEVAAALQERGRSVTWLTASGVTRSIPYGAFASHLPTPSAEIGEQSVLMASLLDALKRQATQAGPLVLILDDVADLDEQSIGLVDLACRNRTVSVVMTQRKDKPPPATVTGLWKDGVIERVELGPLDRSATNLLAEAVIGGPVDSFALSQLWRRSAGNPLYLRELILAEIESGTLVAKDGVWRTTVAAPPSARLTELVRERLGRLGRDQERAVEALAVGGRVDMAVVDRLVDDVAIENLEEARLAVVEQDGNRKWIRLAHPLYDEVVLAGMPRTRMRRLMAELADALEETGTRRREDLLRLSLWRIESGGAPAREVLLRAAADALASFDAPLAERLARAALAVSSDAVAHLLMGRALMAQQRVGEATESLERAAREARSDDEVAQVALARADLLYFRAGNPAEASQVLREAVNAVTDAHWQDELDGLLVLFSAGAGELHGVADAGRRIVQRAGARPRTVVHILVFSSVANVMLGRFGEALDQAETGLKLIPKVRSELPLSGDMLAINRSMARSYAGDVAASVQLGEAGRDHGLERGIADVVGLWSMGLAESYLLAGQLEPSLRTMLSALASARESDPFGIRGIAAAVASLCASWLGRHEQARDLNQEIVEQGLAVDSRSRIWFDRASAWADLAVAGAEATARRLVDTGRAAIAETHIVWAAWQFHDVVRLGHPELVSRRLTEIAARVEGAFVPAMARQAIALEAGDAVELERVASAFEQMGSWLFAAEAAAQAQRAYLRRGRFRLARVAGARASMLASRSPGARTPPLVNAAPVPLTSRELEIARLAADGHSSRVVADRLGISVRTVDNHLGSVYSKVGIAGRAELPAVLGVELPAQGPELSPAE